MNKITSYITSSQTRIFCDSENFKTYTSATVLNNEPFSLTLAYKAHTKECLPISVKAEAQGADIAVYKVGYVPVTHAKSNFDEYAEEGRGVGIYPDILYPRSAEPDIIKINDRNPLYYEAGEFNHLNATNDAYQSVLICVNESGKTLDAGEYKININITSLEDGSILANHTFLLRVIGERLHEPDIMYTNWFHYDCIADAHSLKIYTDEYFSMLEKYLINACKNGMNTILLPAFTPALDTYRGVERMNTQLVKIYCKGENYEFDFSLLEKFINLARNCGIKYFEHAPLFTQWGAEHAPNIYAWVGEDFKRIFGWETDASDDEYKCFLNDYLTQFILLAQKLGIKDRIIFHISDEPTFDNKETYGKAVETARPLIGDLQSGDALDDIRFYENGFVKTPIVLINRADNFFGKCDNMWLYYTGGVNDAMKKCSNRLLTSKPYRTRILGLHLYKYKAKGFLHWGYNYYYDRMSHGFFDPKSEPCGYKQLPGVSFIAYPGVNCVYSSLREKYMLEAINDFRALKVLEEYIGYDAVINLCENFFKSDINCFTIPKDAEEMLQFRDMINNEIEKQILK